MFARPSSRFSWFRRLAGAAALIAWLSAAASAGATNTDPQPQIEQTTKQLLMELREKSSVISSDRQVAYDLGEKFIVPFLDFPTITQLVIGKYWRQASDQQKQRLVEEIRDMIIRSYVTAMTGYADQIVANGDKITYAPSRYKTGDQKAVVQANLQLASGKAVDVDYMLFDNAGAWKIYDIRVAGVSLAVTYRTSYGVEIQRVGLDGLINELAEANSRDSVDFPGAVPNEIRNLGIK